MSQASRRSFLAGFTAVAGAGALSGLLRAAAAATGPARLNFLFILMDDMGWADLGCYGSIYHETPNLDRLASQGMRFTQAYAACPVCSPTRSALLTGKSPAKLRVTDFLVGKRWPNDSPITPVPWRTTGLDPAEVTIAEILKAGGYATGQLGKWHVGGKPQDHGFDTVVPPPPKAHWDGTGRYEDAYFLDHAGKFLEAQKDGPFYLQLWPALVHIPLQGDPELVKKYREKEKPAGDKPQDSPVYAAMMESTDRLVGGVLKKLDDLGLAQRTVVIFSSDNGGLAMNEGGTRPTSNAPWREGKGFLYEGGIRVPYLVRWPGVVKPGSTCDVPITSVDFLPTIAALSGSAARLPADLEGQNIAPLLRGETGRYKPSPLFWHYPHYANQGGPPGAAVRIGDDKLIHWYATDAMELYDLKTDPGETTNLVPARPDKVKALRALLDEWRTRTAAQIPEKRAP